MTAKLADLPRHSVSVAGVIVDDAGEQVLLIRRRDNGHWEPPGGVLELDEGIEDGLRREIREETGLEITIERLTGIYKNLSHGIIALVFFCRSIGTPENSTAEASAIDWKPIGSVPDLMAPAYAVRVLDAMSSGLASTIREHDGTNLL